MPSDIVLPSRLHQLRKQRTKAKYKLVGELDAQAVALEPSRPTLTGVNLQEKL